MELYAIKYGESYFDSKYIFHNDDINKKLEFHWLFYLIKFNDKIILLDTGFSDTGWLKYYKFTHFKEPENLINQLKIDAGEVTDVIITHTHFDHVENVHLFQNAKIYIQKDELGWYLNNRKDKKAAIFLKNNKNVITFDDSYLLYDTFKIKNIGGHSIGSSVISFTYNDKKYMIAGDECYINRNFLENKPVGTICNLKNNADFIMNLKNKYDVILTFHEPSIVGNEQNIVKLIP